jgi:hypothetical protein
MVGEAGALAGRVCARAECESRRAISLGRVIRFVAEASRTETLAVSEGGNTKAPSSELLIMSIVSSVAWARASLGRAREGPALARGRDMPVARFLATALLTPVPPALPSTSEADDARGEVCSTLFLAAFLAPLPTPDSGALCFGEREAGVSSISTSDSPLLD